MQVRYIIYVCHKTYDDDDAVQRFLCRTRRLYFDEENKPHNEVLAIPENHADP